MNEGRPGGRSRTPLYCDAPSVQTVASLTMFACKIGMIVLAAGIVEICEPICLWILLRSPCHAAGSVLACLFLCDPVAEVLGMVCIVVPFMLPPLLWRLIPLSAA